LMIGSRGSQQCKPETWSVRVKPRHEIDALAVSVAPHIAAEVVAAPRLSAYAIK